MRRLADGDRDAARPVFSGLWPELRRFAARALDEEAADDVAQRALVTLFGEAAGFDPARDALAWGLALTAWEVRTERKRRTRARLDPLPARDVTTAPDDPSREVEERRRAAALHETLAELPALDRETIEAVLDERRPDDVAEAAFRKRKERALGRLRTIWRLVHGE